jgi:hypothetical protein
VPGRYTVRHLPLVALTEDGTSLAKNLRTLTLLEDVAGTMQGDRLVIKPHLALGYAGGMLRGVHQLHAMSSWVRDRRGVCSPTG